MAQRDPTRVFRQLLSSKLVQRHVILDILGNKPAVRLRHRTKVAGGKSRVGRQCSKASILNDVSGLAAGQIRLEVRPNRRDGLGLVGLVIGDEFGELLFEQLVPRLKTRNEVKNLLQYLAQGYAPIHSRGLAQLGEGVVLLGLVENFLIHIVDGAIPLARLDSLGNEVVFAHLVGKAVEEHPVNPHPLGADLLLLNRREEVVPQVLVLANIYNRPWVVPVPITSIAQPRQFQYFVVVELVLEVLAVAEEVEQLEGWSSLGRRRRLRRGPLIIWSREVVLSGAASLDLDEIRRREYRPEQAQVENVGAVVAGSHHADSYAYPRLARPVLAHEVAGPQKVIVGKVDRELLGVRNVRRNLHRKVRLVLARKHAVGNLVEELR